MADQGFIVNDAVVTVIGGAYAIGKAILLQEDAVIDPNSKEMPQACYLSHIELQLDATAGSPATVSCFLTWDSAGDDPMTAEAQTVALNAGLSDPSLLNTAISMDVWVRAPAGQTTAGKCYLFLKVDAGVVSCLKARLCWAARNGG